MGAPKKTGGTPRARAERGEAAYLDAAARAAFLRLVHLLRIEKQALYVVLIYAVGIGLASLGAPIGVQMLVSAIAFGGLVQPIVVLSILVLIALAFAGALRATQAWVVERVQQRLFVRVAADLARRLPRVQISSFEPDYAPELVNRFFDVVTLQKGAAMLFLDGLFVALQVIVGGVLLALYHPALLAFAGGLLVAVVAILFGLSGRGATTSIEESKAKYALAAWFEEVARHPTLFRGHGSRFAIARSDELAHDYITHRKEHFRIVFRQTVAFIALQALATAALLAVGGVLVLGGKLTLGQLVAAELILTGVVAGFAKFGKYLEIYYDLIAAMDKLGTLVDLPLEGEATGALRGDDGALSLRLASVEYAHDGAASGVGPVTFDVAAGERVAILGSNGAGKSTLMDIVFGLRMPTRGHVEIDGLPLRDLSIEHVREHVALVRGAAIFEGSVLDNLCMKAEDVPLEEVRRALETVDLWEEVTSLPDGLGTRLGTGGTNLSAGQAQRLAIARALVERPRCLLLDEALDTLDSASRETILGRILGPGAPWTVLVSTHDPDVARACTKRVFLERPVRGGHTAPGGSL